jgi:long-subunit acyl-CoA synthetase (AMP-forming)
MPTIDGLTRGTGARFLLRLLVALFDLLVFRKVRQAFGGELKFFMAAAPYSTSTCSASSRIRNSMFQGTD